MKKITIVSVLVLAVALVAVGCRYSIRSVRGSGDRKTDKRDVSSFKVIDAEGAFTVDVVCQKPQSFAIEADDNILPLIQSDVRDGVLYLRTERMYNSPEGIVIHVTVPNLQAIKSTGASKFQISDLKNDKFTVQSNGASSVTAAGDTMNVEIHNAGAGKIDTEKLHAKKANVDIAGAAIVDVYASEELDADVSGIGRVSYSGDPKTVNKNVSGMGSVSKKE